MMRVDLQMITPGLSAVVQKKIESGDTALNYGSGELGTLLATPAYVDLLISASVEAVDKHLPEGFITVGQAMSFTHEAPTWLDMTVSVKSTLKQVDGNRLVFDIVAVDEYGNIGYGTHNRIVVNREQMLKRAKERRSAVVKDYIK